MTSIRTSLATISAIVLSLGFALPAAALNVNGTVNSATQGTVQVGGTGVNADVGVDVSADTRSSATSSTGEAQTSGDVNATMEASGSVELQPLIITRGDVDGGTVQATVSAPSAVKTRAELSGYVAGEMKTDTNITSVEAASDNVSVTYKQSAKLFGFIPVVVDATADVDASGKVTVSYPWYAFLMATNKSDLETRIQNKVSADVSFDASANAEASAAAEAATQLTADAQAQIVAAVKAAMQAQLNAELNASANGSVSAR